METKKGKVSVTTENIFPLQSSERLRQEQIPRLIIP